MGRTTFFTKERGLGFLTHLTPRQRFLLFLDSQRARGQ